MGGQRRRAARGRCRRHDAASEPRELSKPERASGMRGWAGKALGGESLAGRPDSGASEIKVVGRGLVELELGDGLGLGGVERGCLIEEPGEEIAIGEARGRARGAAVCGGGRGGGGWRRRRADR